MKRQYLGDARDAFKWDLLHWICTTSSFSHLVFVPLLTPDAEDSNEGLISHHRFKCRSFIRPFLDSLKVEPRTLNRISALGALTPEKQFQVSVFAPDRFIGFGAKRRDYWDGFDPSLLENAVVFFDPDNGYETKTQRGPKWLEHQEIRNLFARLPETSVAVVYQHRPHRKWTDVFADFAKGLAYVHTAVAVQESTLAFVAMAANITTGRCVATAMEKYAAQHADVGFTRII